MSDYIVSDQTIRILELDTRFNKGEIINKENIASIFDVDPKTIQRDIAALNEYYKKVDGKNFRKIQYSRKDKGHKLNSMRGEFSESDIFAIAKILLESRAFSKIEMNRIIESLINNCSNDNNVKSLISNELFHYVETKHNKEIVDFIWSISKSIWERKIANVSYTRQDATKKKYNIKPLGLIFNEFYFYLIAEIIGKDKYYPAVFRVDRFNKYTITDEKFSVNYKDRFEEGEYRKRIHFMYQGELIHIQFKFWGDSLDAILDKIPTARVVKETEDYYLIEAEVYDKGIVMWILSQREFIEIVRPLALRNEIKAVANRILKLYTEI